MNSIYSINSITVIILKHLSTPMSILIQCSSIMHPLCIRYYPGHWRFRNKSCRHDPQGTPSSWEVRWVNGHSVASAQLVKLSPRHREEVPMEEEENRLGRRGRAQGGFLEEVMLELNQN